MEMVSVSKLKALQKQFSNSNEYFTRLQALLNNFLASFKTAVHPLLEKRPNKKKILLCLVTSDTGLCGSYNSNIIHAAEEFIRKNSTYSIEVVSIGRKGLNHFKKTGLNILYSYTELYGHYSNEFAAKVAKNLIDVFLSGRADEVYVAYANFESASRIRPSVEKLLNVEASNGRQAEYLIEPDVDGVLEELLPLYISSKIGNILLSAFTAEHSTRVIAMQEATDNAKDLREDLIILRNKMRQADITGELIEVISSVEALKG
jgi:F-type H+-transporting ATPase subunit gamma